MAERVHPSWGLVVLRVVLGIIFLVHGWDKLFLGSGVPGLFLATSPQPAPSPGVLAWLVAFVEFLGGIFLLIGWLTRWAAGILFLGLLVSMAILRLQHGFFVFRPFGEWGYEYHLALLAGLACLVLGGGGRLGMDVWRFGRR